MSELNCTDEHFVGMSGELNERSITCEDFFNESKGFINGWSDSFVNSRCGIKSILFSSSGRVSVDQFSGFLF